MTTPPAFPEELFRELGDQLPDFIWLREVESGKVLYVNSGWERFTGVRVPVGASYREFFKPTHPGDRERAERAGRLYPAGGYDEVLRFVHADGTTRRVHIRTFAVRNAEGQVYRVLGIGQDVTGVFQVEEALRASEQKFRSLIEHVTDIIAVLGADGTLQYLSPAFETVLGFTTPAWLGRPLTEAVWPDDVARATALFQQSLEQPGHVIAWELRIRHADGGWRWLEGSGTNHLADAAIAGIVINCHDVTERRRREEALRRMQQAMDTSINGVSMTDAAGKITYANPAFLRSWGFDTEAEVLGKEPTMLGEPERTGDVLRALRERGSWQGELQAIRKDGSTFPILLSASAVRDDRGEVLAMLGSFLDLTDAKRLEAELLQAAKMESVGRLAGGVAHDFNNLLTVIKGNASLALLETEPGLPLAQYLEGVVKAADSAALLTQQLLAFSRKQIISPRIVDLNEVIERVHRMLGRLLGEHIQVETFAARDLGLVRLDPGQAEQILVNLAVNARDAMPDGGKLTLETANVYLDEEYAKRHPGVPGGQYVRLAVSDTGTGMSEDIRQHLFEPFFTTKAAGRGTGLGLAMVHGAVQQNAGLIEVYSEPAHGTTFKIYLPVVSGEAESLEAPPASPPARGTETIVLVEDDESVRVLAAILLQRQGYTVHSFGDTAQALEMVERLEAPVHLLITDVVMPTMNGQALATRLIGLRPNTRVLYTSGYTANVIVHHGVLKEGVEFLAKPYSADELARRVRATLDKPA